MRQLITTAAPNGGGVTFPPEPRMEEPVAWGDGGESSHAAGVLRHRVFRAEPWRVEPEQDREQAGGLGVVGAVAAGGAVVADGGGEGGAGGEAEATAMVQ